VAELVKEVIKALGSSSLIVNVIYVLVEAVPLQFRLVMLRAFFIFRPPVE